MVGALIGLKVATLRHEWRSSQSSWLWSGLWLGVLLAAWSLYTVVSAPDLSHQLDLVAVLFALWAAGWMLLPVLGGSGGDPLRPENFRLLALPMPRLAAGLLVGGAIGVLPVVSIAAFSALLLPATGLGPAAVLVAIIAVAVMLAFVIVLSRVVVGALSRAMETRLGLEVAAFQYALILALSSFWIPLIALSGNDGTSVVAIDFRVGDLVRVLPTGWGVVAVEAVGRSDWLLAILAIGGQIALIGLLALAWSSIVARRLQLSPGAARPTRGLLDRLPWPRLERAIVPPTRLGAVVAKELRAWVRHPRRTLELRAAIWNGALLAFLPGFIGSTILWPWTGLIVIVIAGFGLANVYGKDGSAFWLTLLTPGSARVDVRGRQLAWLLIVGAISVVVSLVLTLASEFRDVWPYIAAILPALLGAGAGVGIFLAVFAPAPLPDRRGADPLDIGDDPSTGASFVIQGVTMYLLVPLLAVPAVIAAQYSAVAGVGAGLLTGALYAWAGGWLAAWRLERAGPEMLERLRARPVQRPSREAAVKAGKAPVSRRRSLAINVLALVGAVLLFPQGIVAIFLKLQGLHNPVWFVALYLPEPWPIPVAATFAALGATAWYLVWRLSGRPAGSSQESGRQGHG